MGGQRLKSLYDQFIELIQKYNPDMVLIETPVGGDEDHKGAKSNWTTMNILSQVQGVLLLAIETCKKPVEMVSPSAWQFTTRIHKRDRTSRKIGAREFVEKNYKITNVIQDVCDSICIGYHYIETIRRKEQSEVSAF